MSKKKVAIACQGGGSQTAFTAGVLYSLFEKDIHKKFDLVGLSGTSGGSVCASLAWYGMLKAAQGDDFPIHQRLTDFWEDLSAQHPVEVALENIGADYMRSIEKGMMPHLEMSPVSVATEMFNLFLKSILPRSIFTDLKAMLQKHIDFGAVPGLIRPDSPLLIIGAADVLTGELKKFYSNRGEFQVEAILASAAVPSLFPAVKIGDHYYWDGMFSDNPPIKEFVRPVCLGSAERLPDEIWIVQINSETAKTVPTTPAQIIDRRNQMVGNVSMRQSMETVEIINRLLEHNLISEEYWDVIGIAAKRPIKMRQIKMSQELLDSLDYVSKISRTPEHINRLITEGKHQGNAFLETLSREASEHVQPRRAKSKLTRQQVYQHA